MSAFNAWASMSEPEQEEADRVQRTWTPIMNQYQSSNASNAIQQAYPETNSADRYYSYGNVYQDVAADYPNAPDESVGAWTTQLLTMPGSAPYAPGTASMISGGGGGGGGFSWGGGGGGGGGGGMSLEEQKANALRMSGYLMDLINSPMFEASGYFKDKQNIRKATRKDIGAARRSYRGLNRYLHGPEQSRNPYAGNRQRPVNVRPGVAALARSQGVPTAGFGQERALVNAEGRQLAQNWNALNRTLGAGYRNDLATRMLEGKQARNYSIDELRSADNALFAFLDQQKREEQRAMDQQKLQIMLQLAQLLGPLGLDMPTLSQIGLAPPEPEEQDQSKKKKRKKKDENLGKAKPSPTGPRTGV